jgi:integrase
MPPLKITWPNGIAYISGTIAGHPRIRKSLGTRDPALAEILRIEIEGRLVRESVYGKGSEATFADAALKYLEAGRPRRFVAALIEALGKKRLNMIQPGDIKQLALELCPNAKPATLNRSVLKPAAAIINHAAELGLCHHIRVKSFPVAKVIRRAVQREWIDAFRARANPWLGALALFMFTTGARLGDAVALLPEHVDLDQNIAIRPTSKTGDPRVFYLTDEMVAVLRALPPRKGRVFGYTDNSGVSWAWKKVCERAQIPYRVRHEAGRHSFATEALVRRKIDPVTVAKIGGWRNPSQLLSTYAHPENLPDVVEEVFGRGTKLAQQGLEQGEKIKKIK